METLAIIAAVNAALTLVSQGISVLQSRKQNKEMTAEEEAAYDKLVQERMKLEHWKRSK